MTLLSISERVAALTDMHKEYMASITRLSRLSTPSPDLASQIHAHLREAESEYELLVDEVSSSPPTSNLHALRAKVSKIGEDQRFARAQYRKAQLSLKRAEERETLLGGAAARAAARKGQGQTNEGVSQADLMLSASSDVTAALRRTQQLLQGELTKSAFASETLATSTEALKELEERYSAFDDVLGKSRMLIKDLVKKNKSDRWYYEKAIQILIGILVWILVRRLFWGPLYLLFVLPVKTGWWVLGSVGGLVTGGGGAGGAGGGSGGAVSSISAKMSPSVSGTVTEVYSSVPTMNTQVEEQEEQVGDAKTTATMSEVVASIIEGESTTIVRNTKSRKFEHDPAAESAASTSQEEKEPESQPESQPEQEPSPEAERIRDEL